MQSHPELTRLLILNLHNKQVNLAGVDFSLTSDTIAHATGIPDVGEKWFKIEKLDMSCYDPFLKPR